MNTTLITGNTYPVKEQLKALGGKWNPGLKGWAVPTDRAEEAQDLVTSQRYQSTIYTLSSGHEIMVNKRGRCEDAPCCGCCS